jgi:hypothetical protein
MKTIVKQKPVEEVLIYETSDGEQFEYEWAAERHEMIIKIKHKELGHPIPESHLVYLESLKELKWFEFEYYDESCLRSESQFNYDNFVFPNWFVGYLYNGSVVFKTRAEFKKLIANKLEI